MMMEPSVSVPRATGANPAATPTALPEAEPAGHSIECQNWVRRPEGEEGGDTLNGQTTRRRVRVHRLRMAFVSTPISHREKCGEWISRDPT